MILSTTTTAPTMPIPTLLFFLLLLTTATSSDLSALLAFRSAVSGRTLFWNTTFPTPCNWQGVSCTNNRVTSLRLPAASLSGSLPPNTLSNLTSLRTLSLRLNHLSGPLPEDLSRLPQLRNLYLQGNRFSGSVTDLVSLKTLVRLNLADNEFSGEIPSGFSDLKRLRTLLLESNNFSGVLPDLVLPNLRQFNVSFNGLVNGSVPDGLVGMGKEAFLGTLVCGKVVGNECVVDNVSGIVIGNSGTRSRRGKKKRISGGAIAGIVIGCVVGLFLLVLVCLFLCRKRRDRKTSSSSVDMAAIKTLENEAADKPMVGAGGMSSNNGFAMAAVAAAASNGSSGKSEARESMGVASKKLVFFGKGAKVFDLEELLRASAEVLGKGTFGTAYKAVLEAGTVVAVKRLKDVMISEGEFKEKIEGVGRMEHKNLLPLRAYYFSGEEKLLVYDYMPMGSLSALLHGNKGAGRTPLNWDMRSRIALGAARGIEHLHFQNSNFAHGNIKSSNVLLTNSYDALVSDFGLNNLVGPSTSPTRITGYRAPEVTDPRKVSQKADVYSFGVLLLELLTGKAPSQALMNDEGVDLPRWVQSIVREEWTSEVFDLELLRHQNVEDEMVQLLQLGIDCTAQYPDNRPSISEVARRIEELCRFKEKHDDVSEAD